MGGSPVLPKRMRWSAVLRWVVAVGLFVALVAWVERAFGWVEVLSAWSVLTPGDVALVLSLVAVGYAARALRLGAHFGSPLNERPWRCLRVMALHNALNNLLPARTGEISFPVLLAREFGVKASRSITALFWLRLLDLGTLVALSAATVGVMRFGVFAGVAVAIGAVVAPFGLWRWSRGSTAEGSSPASGWRRRIHEGLPASMTAVGTSVGWTLLHWGVKVLAYAWLLHRFAEVPSGPAVLGAIAGEFTSVLPIHGLAGAGTYEAGVLLVLEPLGVELERAVTAAVNLHLFLLVVSIVAAIAAWTFGARRPGPPVVAPDPGMR